ncbi:MAG: hydantoinase/oxoprolinase family protein [Desulfovibrio sp.]|nr:hydantoinase/oxoprolinase family protein [Desulfovibrio sp.]
MQTKTLLGIDAGGTHTDAVVLRAENGRLTTLATAKVNTCHENLGHSVAEVLKAVRETLADDAVLAGADAVTLGATLAVNALVQDRADPVGLALSAGPGLDPGRFAIGDRVCILPGGLDHRGVEVTPLDTAPLDRDAKRWRSEGVKASACVGKFSPRNPAHECAMEARARNADLRVSLGHRLSGSLNFPRRIATAYYNAAVERIHDAFVDAVETSLGGVGIKTAPLFLKADGGAMPAALSRRLPVQSILSGPAASAMGAMVLCPEADEGCSLLLDMGGTTTDMAILLDGSAVVDRDGMRLNGRRTLVRALASLSIGVGGDSRLTVEKGSVAVGPLREGPAMAFGGGRPTFLDALNILRASEGLPGAGDESLSRKGMEELAANKGVPAPEIARKAVDDASRQVTENAARLLDRINARPIYTLAALKAVKDIAPSRVILVGGPAECMRPYLAKAFGLPVVIPAHADVANAVGAAATLPTVGLDVYADTGQRTFRAPALDIEEAIQQSCTPKMVQERALELLAGHMAAEGMTDQEVELMETDVFAVLDDYGRSSKDIRVSCRAVAGIRGRF